MRQTWDRMAKQDPLDPKALLALALRLRQRAVDEINKCIARPTSDEITEILRDIDNRIFEMHTCCAAECLKAEEYQATLEHTKSAIKLNETWDRMWQESVVMYVLDSEKEAWLRLGDFSRYLDVAKHRARAMAEFGRTINERALTSVLRNSRGAVAKPLRLRRCRGNGARRSPWRAPGQSAVREAHARHGVNGNGGHARGGAGI